MLPPRSLASESIVQCPAKSGCAADGEEAGPVERMVQLFPDGPLAGELPTHNQQPPDDRGEASALKPAPYEPETWYASHAEQE